jgi:hypothetical protein
MTEKDENYNVYSEVYLGVTAFDASPELHRLIERLKKHQNSPQL